MSSKHKLYRSMIPVPSRGNVGRGCLSRSTPFLVVDSINVKDVSSTKAAAVAQEPIEIVETRNKSASISHLNFEILAAGVSVAKKIERFQCNNNNNKQTTATLTTATTKQTSPGHKFWKKKDSTASVCSSEVSCGTSDTAYSSISSSSVINRKPSCSSSASTNAEDIKISNTSRFTNPYDASENKSTPTEKTNDKVEMGEKKWKKKIVTVLNDVEDKGGHCTVISMSTNKTRKEEEEEEDDADEEGQPQTEQETTTSVIAVEVDCEDNYQRQSDQLCQSVAVTDEQQQSRLNKQLKDTIQELSTTVEEKERLVEELYAELHKRDEQIAAYVDEIRKRKADMIRMSKILVDNDNELRLMRAAQYCHDPEATTRYETRSVAGGGGGTVRPHSQLSTYASYSQETINFPNKWLKKILKKSTTFASAKKSAAAHHGDHNLEYVDELREMLREKEMLITDLRFETKLAAHRLAELEASLQRKKEESYAMKMNNDYLEKAIKAKLLD